MPRGMQAVKSLFSQKRRSAIDLEMMTLTKDLPDTMVLIINGLRAAAELPRLAAYATQLNAYIASATVIRNALTPLIGTKVPRYIRNALYRPINSLWNSDRLTPAMAAKLAMPPPPNKPKRSLISGFKTGRIQRLISKRARESYAQIWKHQNQLDEVDMASLETVEYFHPAIVVPSIREFLYRIIDAISVIHNAVPGQAAETDEADDEDDAAEL